MASCAGVRCHVLFADHFSMDVFMAIYAPDGWDPEIPFAVFFVTGNACGCQMGAVKGKPALVVPFDSKLGWSETLYRMTSGTFR
jgi:hypothetical protein